MMMVSRMGSTALNRTDLVDFWMISAAREIPAAQITTLIGLEMAPITASSHLFSVLSRPFWMRLTTRF